MSARAAVTGAALLVLLLLVLSTSGPAAAQATNESWDPATECTLPVDDEVRVCDREYRGGMAVLELHANESTRVRLTDGSRFLEGGDLSPRWFTVDGRTTIEYPAGTYRGMAAVGVQHDTSIIGVPIRSGGVQLVDGPATWGYVSLAGLVGFVGTFGGTALWIKRREGATDDEPRSEVLR